MKEPSAPSPLGDNTKAIILSLLAGGITVQEVRDLYPDIAEKDLQKTIRSALRKAPMFLEP